MKDLKTVAFSKLQLFMLMQGCIMEMRTGMSLTRMFKPFRKAFKEATGMPARAKNLDVLVAIGLIYKNNFNDEAGFFEYINKEHCLLDGKAIVTPEMLT